MLPVPLKSSTMPGIENGQRPSKRPRIEQNGEEAQPTSDLMSQVKELAGVFSATLDL